MSIRHEVLNYLSESDYTLSELQETTQEDIKKLRDCLRKMVNDGLCTRSLDDVTNQPLYKITDKGFDRVPKAIGESSADFVDGIVQQENIFDREQVNTEDVAIADAHSTTRKLITELLDIQESTESVPLYYLVDEMLDKASYIRVRLARLEDN